VGDGRT
jgi:hypothetical protein